MTKDATSWKLFPQEPSLGKYLWGWVERYGLDGESYAPTSMAGHHFITRAALDALPEARAWLGGEADLMTWAYCGFPDMNWAHYGGFLDEYPQLAGVRLPDYRRAWEISRYCQFNPATKRGKFIGHGPPTSWGAFARHYGRAVRAMEQGRKWDAVRILGMSLHYLEDSGAPPHVVEGMDAKTHRAAESVRDPSGIRIDGYRPKAFRSPERLARSVTDDTVPLAKEVWRRLEKGLDADVLDLQTECALRCARATADALAAFHRLFSGVRLEAPPPRIGVNLLKNGDFARPGDVASLPAGWFVEWSDRTDRAAGMTRRCEGERWVMEAAAPAKRVQMAPSWPRVARVAPGGRYRVTGRVSPSGRAGVFVEVLDASTRLLARQDFAASSKGWRETGGAIETGAGAAFLRAGVWAEATDRPARFAELRLVREA